jgi:hypothetical protein
MRAWWVGLGLVALVALGFLAVDWTVSAAVVGGAAAGTAAVLLGRLPAVRRVAAAAALSAPILPVRHHLRRPGGRRVRIGAHRGVVPPLLGSTRRSCPGPPTSST